MTPCYFRPLALAAILTFSWIPSLSNGAMFYWTQDGNIFRANLDGTSVEQIYSRDDTDLYAHNLDIDPQNGYLYWLGGSGTGAPAIRRSALNGAGVQDVITTGLGPSVYGLAVDVANQKLYVGQHIPLGPGSGIQYLNTDGTGLGKLPTTVYYPHQIEVDPLNGQLYFGDVVGFDGLRRSNLDGTGVQDLVTGTVVGEALDLDVPNNKMYYSHNEGSLGANTYQIWSSDLDGGNQQLLLDVANRTNDIEVWNGKLFWTNQFGIWSADLDGSNPQQAISFDAGNPWGADGFAIVPEPSSATLAAVAIGFVLVLSRARRLMRK